MSHRSLGRAASRVRVPSSLIESLEPRSLLSTVPVSVPKSAWSLNGSGHSVHMETDQKDEIGDPIDATGDSISLTVQLPKHSMINVFATANEFDYYGLPDDARVHVQAGSQSMDLKGYNGLFEMAPDANGNDQDNHWKADNNTSLTVTFTPTNFPDDAYIFAGVSIWVYTPTVSISGGGSTDEDNSGSAVFSVSADLPSWWTGTSNGDDEIPPIHVDLDKHGTATDGVDYVLEPDVTIPSRSTLDDPSSTDVPLTVLDDSEAEGFEDAEISIASTSEYIASAGSAVAVIDDNVSVESIKVDVEPVAYGGVVTNTSGGYNFHDFVEIKGEHLDRVEFTQLINSSTSFVEYDGHIETQSEVMGHFKPGTDPHVVNSNGWEVDTNWQWQPPTVVPNTKDGVAYGYDQQLFTVPDGTQVKFNPNDPNSPVTKLHYEAGTTADYKVFVRKSGETANLKSLAWGYKWDNYNSIWSNNPYPNLYSVCTAEFVASHGEFSGAYGIAGLP